MIISGFQTTMPFKMTSLYGKLNPNEHKTQLCVNEIDIWGNLDDSNTVFFYEAVILFPNLPKNGAHFAQYQKEQRNLVKHTLSGKLIPNVWLLFLSEKYTLTSLASINADIMQQ